MAGLYFSPQNCPFAWGFGPHDLMHGSLGPIKSTPPFGVTIGSPFSRICRDHGRDHLASTAMRPKNRLSYVGQVALSHVPVSLSGVI